jgi:outer membrane protein assembly factor BamE (lipoprotein component of BamABCDE complex)
MRYLSILVCIVLAGCLVTSHNEEKVQGKYVAEATFDQIKPGKTSAGWVKATLGEPSEVTHVDASQSEVWKYAYTVRKEGGGAIFLIFGGHNVKERPYTAFVEIKDGVVTNKWRG